MVVKIQVLDPQPQSFEQAHARATHQPGNELRDTIECIQQPVDFIASQHRG